MKHTQLRSFHTVAKLGSFSEAAKALNVSQPTITAQVKELEQRYNVALFFRQRSNNRLTDVGRQLFEQTTLMFSIQERAKKLLEANGALKVGQFKMGAVSPAAALPLVERFKRHYPQVEITMSTGGSAQIRNAVLSGELEAAMLAYRDPNPKLVSQKIAEQPVVLVVPKSHPLSSRTEIDLEELENTKIIHREHGSTTRKILEDELLKRGINIQNDLEIDSREGVREASIYGLGISYVGLHEFQPHPDITMLSIRNLETKSKSYLIYLKELEALPIIKILKRFLSEGEMLT
ncbi:LysR substrate-binding domain-containing protein [Vibrio sp. 10N]|uniref:LysR substrate-binding domain-containing protein n=1 Tax=Vibrio sp. 10N TaxID=3058938 RepID=UPI0028145BCF|nr:LysR family transcriptional regulator [Vibrio sp. 10N]